MGTPDSIVRAVRRQLGWTLAGRRAVGALTLGFFAWGVAVLAVRAVGGPEASLGWLLATGGGVVLVGAVVAAALAWRRLPEERAIRALCDRQQACGGLVMSEGEVGLGAWDQRRRLAPAAVQWQSGRHWALLTVGVGFFALCLAVPHPPAAQQQRAAVQVAGNIDALEERLDLLEEEDVFDADAADELREQLRQMRETAWHDAMQAWERLDHVEQQLTHAAEEAAEQAVSQTAELAEIGALAEALAQDQMSELPRLDGLEAADALDQLADMLSELDPDLARALAEAGLDADDLRELADQLRERSVGEDVASLDPGTCDLLTQMAGLCDGAGQGNREQLMQLVEGEMLDPEWLAMCDAAGECDGAARLAMAAGGRQAGTAAAPLNLSDEPVRAEDAAFEATAIAPGAVDREASQLVGLSAAAPEVDLPEQRSDATALDNAATGGGSAASQLVLPRHRGAVERYFERE